MNSNSRTKYQIQNDPTFNQYNGSVNTVDLLEYEDAFILDINRNKRIYISGAKEALKLPQVTEDIS